MKFDGLRIALVGPLPPPAGGMANQTRQLAELLRGEGASVELVQVNAPYKPAWAGRIKGVRAAFRVRGFASSQVGPVGRWAISLARSLSLTSRRSITRAFGSFMA